ncbi:MAG TPA: ABC transporter ATP-binding protein [Gammaproteobacteria bacterium]|nr:ABC transporter ATP-binding protein [Gammaproteobacteria bacterium]
MSAAVRIAGVSKRFGAQLALDGVTFDVPAQSVFGLLGPNGAGKTTLFSIVASFLKPDAGTIEVLGKDPSRISELAGRLTILPQDAEFQRNTPILEQLIFFRMLDGRDRAAAEREALDCLELVGLHDYAKRSARTLSHGMQKRLGIAQAFLGQPEVILLDEPTAGLDPANARQIRDLVASLRKRATIVVSSHNLGEIQELCDHVAILDHGRLVTAGPVADLTAGARELEMRLSRPLDSAEIARLTGAAPVDAVDASNAPDYRLRLAAHVDWDAALALVLKALLDIGVVPRRMHEGRSLERHFLEVTGGERGARADNG